MRTSLKPGQNDRRTGDPVLLPAGPIPRAPPRQGVTSHWYIRGPGAREIPHEDVMCRRSRLGGWWPLGMSRPATRAGTGGHQPLEGVDARAVAVAPLHTQTVPADQRHRDRADVLGHRPRLEEWAPRHLVQAHGTAAGEPELARGVEGLVVAGRPLDEEAVVA